MKRLTISLTIALLIVIATAGAAFAALPDPQQPTGMLADSIMKSVEPTGIVDRGDTLTYTIMVDLGESTIVGLPVYFVDPVSPGLTNVQFIEQPAGIEWNDMYHAITGMITTTSPITISFTADVQASGTFRMGSDIVNQAALCQSDTGGMITMVSCPETSNVVTNPTMSYLFLPVIMRGFTPSTIMLP